MRIKSYAIGQFIDIFRDNNPHPMTYVCWVDPNTNTALVLDNKTGAKYHIEGVTVKAKPNAPEWVAKEIEIYARVGECLLWTDPAEQLPPRHVEVLAAAIYRGLIRRLIATRDEDGVWRTGNDFQEAMQVVKWAMLPELPDDN